MKRKIKYILLAVLIVIAIVFCVKLHLYDKNNKKYEFDYWGKNEKVTITGYNGDECDITLPVTDIIGDNAFKDNEQLRSVYIKRWSRDYLTEIRQNAFEGCINLEKIINLPKKMEYIGTFAFAGCENLKYFSVPNGLESINIGTFYGCKSLKEIIIPYGVRDIHTFSFADCTSLEHIEIPQTVTMIDWEAFEKSDSLLRVSYEGTTEEWYELTKKCDTGLPIGCVIRCSDGKITIQTRRTSNTVYSEERLEYDIPYIKQSYRFIQIPKTNLLSNNASFSMIYTNRFYDVPFVESGDKIVIKSHKPPQNIQLCHIDTDTDRYYSEETIHRSEDETSFTYRNKQVDNINGITDTSLFPIELVEKTDMFGHYEYYYALTNDSQASTCTLGYFNGTEYKETEIDVSYCKADLYDVATLEMQKTKDGYFYITIPQLSSGIYKLNGFDSGYYVQVE